MKGLFLIVTFSFLMGFGSIERLFAPKSDLWPFWEKHDAASPELINHDTWTDLLSRYVHRRKDGVNLFDYRGLSPAGEAQLADYIAVQANILISQYNRDEQLAYWINLYNALTVRVILEHYPVDSIRDIRISPGLFAIGPWGKDLISIEDNSLTLNDIEHRILRPVWRDPRIHYVLNCASIGCPNLQNRAYTSSDIELQLDVAAKAYVNDPRGVNIVDGKISVSKIYDWFISDFGGNEKSVIHHLQRYAEPELAQQLTDIGKLSREHYDWSVNSTDN